MGALLALSTCYLGILLYRVKETRVMIAIRFSYGNTKYKRTTED